MKKYLPLIVIAAIAIAIGGGLALMDSKDEPAKTTNSRSTDNTQSASSGSNQPAVVTDEVEIENLAFSPAGISVKKGTTVTWTNKDSSQHTVTSDSSGGPKSNTLDRDDTYSFTFNETGEFSYHCDFHPSMTGKVTVTE